MSAHQFVLAAAAAGDTAARSQMGSTLAFHIVLACLGIAMPTAILIMHWRGIRHHDETALLLARRWSKVLAVLVAVGAVTGTVLSFEMGLLWPGLMARFGAALGIPFAFEGIFFLLEAVFTAIYLFGWRALSPWWHFASGVPIAVCGLLGGWSVVAANSWMNQPSGFTERAGKVVHVDPVAVFFNRASVYEVPHMLLAAYIVAGFLLATPYAVALLRGRRTRYVKLGFAVPFAMAATATPLQFLVGDFAARQIAHEQPVKFASMEYVVRTSRGVTEWIGGVFVHGHVVGGIGLPDVDSILVGLSPHTRVVGWTSVPARDRPPFPTLIHLAFDAMVGIGSLLVLLALFAALYCWRRRHLPESRLFYAAAALSGVASVVALESGWVVTEVGRQPWVVYHLLRTSSAVTTAGGVSASLVITLVVYTTLGVATLAVLWRMSRRWQAQDEAGGGPDGTGPDEPRSPYEPPALPPTPAPVPARL